MQAWLGLKLHDFSRRTTSAAFEWDGRQGTTQQPLVGYQGWARGEPNNMEGSEECGTATVVGWGDYNCNLAGVYGVMCEKECLPEPLQLKKEEGSKHCQGAPDQHQFVGLVEALTT